jgi:hypothetical protein
MAEIGAQDSRWGNDHIGVVSRQSASFPSISFFICSLDCANPVHEVRMHNPIGHRSRPALTTRLPVSREGVALLARNWRATVASVSRSRRVSVACLSRHRRVSPRSLWGRPEKPLISVNSVNRLSAEPDCTPI